MMRAVWSSWSSPLRSTATRSRAGIAVVFFARTALASAGRRAAMDCRNIPAAIWSAVIPLRVAAASIAAATPSAIVEAAIVISAVDGRDMEYLSPAAYAL